MGLRVWPVVLALLAHGVAVADEAAITPLAACPFAVPEQRRVDCYSVLLPGDRAGASAYQVRLTAAVIHASAAPKAPVPLVLLEGGPGGDAGLLAATAPYWWDYLDRNPWLARRDFIVFAQRGAQPSRPSLTCDAAWRWTRRTLAYPWHQRATTFSGDIDRALGTCLERFEESGARLDAFTTRPVALDALEVARLLGHERFDLLAVSYGTRVALDIMRLRPERLRAVVLDSPLPPTVTDWAPSFAARETYTDRLLALCAADPACAGAWPDLGGGLARLIARLDRSPSLMTVTIPSDHQPVDVWLDGATLRAIVEDTVYDAGLIARVPAAIAAAAAGDIEALRPLVENHAVGVQILDTQWLNRIPYGCNEILLGGRAPGRRFIDSVVGWVRDDDETGWCRDLGLHGADHAFFAPVVSDVPTLLLAGDLDWVTPPAWAGDAARTLANGRLVRLPGLGHAPAFNDDCAAAMAGAFLDDPTGWAMPPCAALPRRFAVP